MVTVEEIRIWELAEKDNRSDVGVRAE